VCTATAAGEPVAYVRHRITTKNQKKKNKKPAKNAQILRTYLQFLSWLCIKSGFNLESSLAKLPHKSQRVALDFLCHWEQVGFQEL